MKHRTTPILFTLLFGIVALSGCASTGTTPASDSATASAATTPAVEESKPAAAPDAEPECD